jgi:hypothetical protein
MKRYFCRSRGKRGWLKDLITRILNDRPVTLAFGTRGNPL